MIIALSLAWQPLTSLTCNGRKLFTVHDDDDDHDNDDDNGNDDDDDDDDEKSSGVVFFFDFFLQFSSAFLQNIPLFARTRPR